MALLRKAEAFHVWTAAKFAELPFPFLTCEPVLAEEYFLLSRQPNGPRLFFELLDSGVLEIDFRVLSERQALGKLIQKYKDLPMSLADACLVRMAELSPGSAVFTLDTHFRVYRKNGRQIIPVIMP